MIKEEISAPFIALLVPLHSPLRFHGQRASRTRSRAMPCMTCPLGVSWREETPAPAAHVPLCQNSSASSASSSASCPPGGWLDALFMSFPTRAASGNAFMRTEMGKKQFSCPLRTRIAPDTCHKQGAALSSAISCAVSDHTSKHTSRRSVYSVFAISNGLTHGFPWEASISL